MDYEDETLVCRNCREVVDEAYMDTAYGGILCGGCGSDHVSTVEELLDEIDRLEEQLNETFGNP